jgi:hypothetical protein
VNEEPSINPKSVLGRRFISSAGASKSDFSCAISGLPARSRRAKNRAKIPFEAFITLTIKKQP